MFHDHYQVTSLTKTRVDIKKLEGSHILSDDASLIDFCTEQFHEGRDVYLDLTSQKYFDSMSVVLCLRLRRIAAANNRKIYAKLHENVLSQLKSMSMSELLETYEPPASQSQG